MKRTIDDLGIAAYLRMHGFNVIGRRGKDIYFEFADDEEAEFEKLAFNYVNSTFHQFDSNLMALKKMRNYTPPEVNV